VRTFTLALILAAVSGSAMAQSSTISRYEKARVTDIQVTRSDGSSYHSRTINNRYGGATYSSTSTPAPQPLEGYNPMGSEGYHPMGR
jgi:hypothetical protein